ncbi:MAG: glycosyltransferase, partial [Myxococcales bacterium]|nr:glycosyltransferase [Myxococcales bacterium]
MPILSATVRDLQSAEYLKSLALGAGDARRALPLWRKARGLDPDSATLASHEAHALLKTGDAAGAVRLLTEALPRWPRLAHLANLFGVALFEAGHPGEATRLFAHCLALDPEYPNAGESLANARAAKRGRPAPAAVRAAVDAALAAAERRGRPTLSVCMIAKDEEAFIGDALASVRGVADQCVVVDTGSTDRTVEICRAAGAEVAFLPWAGDFSAARNASLDHATGDWILVLDADERLTARSRTPLRAILEEYQDDSELRVVSVRIRNLARDGRFLGDGFSGRLFRNRPELRFEGRVHEEVGRSRADVSLDYRLDVEFDHFGA